MKKIGRNDPCPCGSGKKFKKCCEATMIGGRFKATRINQSTSPMASVSKMAGLFKTQMASIPPMPLEVRPIRTASSAAGDATSSAENQEKQDLPKEGIEDKEQI